MLSKLQNMSCCIMWGPKAPHRFSGAPPPYPGVSGVSPPYPDLLFSREKSRQKHAREEKPFRWGFSPVTPSSATTQRGRASAQAPHPSSRRKRQASLAPLRLLLPRQTLRWFASERPLRGRYLRRTPGGTALYLSCCPSGSPGGAIHQNLSMSQSTFSALGSSLVSTY